MLPQRQFMRRPGRCTLGSRSSTRLVRASMHLIGATILATGCSTGWLIGRPEPIGAPADPAEYAPFAQRGALELRGQAFVATGDGGAKVAAGRVVTLDPATRYAREWFRRFGTDAFSYDAPAPDSEFRSARRTTIADARGRFRFGKLAPGVYLVRSAVTWKGVEDSVEQGGVVAAMVEIGANRANRANGANGANGADEADDEEYEVMLRSVMTPDSAAILVTDILSDAMLLERPHRVIARVWGDACRESWDDVTAEEQARKELALRASRRGADAVGRIACEKRGLRLASGCLSRIYCEGDAVIWS